MADDRDYAAELMARIAHLENHIEAVAKDTHKIMVDLSTPLDDPRVKALVEALREAERMLKHYGSRDAGGMAQITAALSALEKNK